ncbi:hypothetical protein DFH09DRAFT_1100049 [Mycena vulgaris]|nr:hypothetical protein DFH09DRAFT_1100049 [Mycena vulgaris]
MYTASSYWDNQGQSASPQSIKLQMAPIRARMRPRAHGGAPELILAPHHRRQGGPKEMKSRNAQESTRGPPTRRGEFGQSKEKKYQAPEEGRGKSEERPGRGIVRENYRCMGGKEGKMMWDKKEGGDSAVAGNGACRDDLRGPGRVRGLGQAAVVLVLGRRRGRAKTATASKVYLIPMSRRLVVGTAGLRHCCEPPLSYRRIGACLSLLRSGADEWMGVDGRTAATTRTHVIDQLHRGDPITTFPVTSVGFHACATDCNAGAAHSSVKSL